ncbi:heme NO-binding domain-containing protein [Crocinitomicaceae bacterium]|nr:heme NO-binding domain-containing protein [Crocinitomicaceae bacterium]
MYGLVNKAIKDLVTENHGDEAWQKVCEIAEFHEGDFISMSPYPDKLTFTLVGAVSQVLKADATDVLEAFGEYWILYTADQGYGNLMDLSGKTFVEFLGNLDMLHYRIANMMPELRPPMFTTRNEKSNSVELEYRSHREGLVPMLYGLIRGLGKRFDMVVKVEQIETRSSEENPHVFLITW